MLETNIDIEKCVKSSFHHVFHHIFPHVPHRVFAHILHHVFHHVLNHVFHQADIYTNLIIQLGWNMYMLRIIFIVVTKVISPGRWSQNI